VLHLLRFDASALIFNLNLKSFLPTLLLLDSDIDVDSLVPKAVLDRVVQQVHCYLLHALRVDYYLLLAVATKLAYDVDILLPSLLSKDKDHLFNEGHDAALARLSLKHVLVAGMVVEQVVRHQLRHLQASNGSQ